MEYEIKCLAGLDREDYEQVLRLERECERADKIAFKLELDYKKNAYEHAPRGQSGELNDFIAFADGQAVGYIGLCDFGGPDALPEVTGMVHPNYRRRGIFSALHAYASGELARRGRKNALLLCDRRSANGHAFLERIGSAYKSCEVEMYLDQSATLRDADEPLGISLRKAVNADAGELRRMDAIFWNEPEPPAEDAKRLPEEEEKRGVTAYLAQKDGAIVGKINLQQSESGVSGIYGFGVLKEHRGKGYGRAILLTALKKLKEAGAKDVLLQVVPENERALNLYKSCGFQETSVMDYYEWTL
ncbi:MAG: GNAT family N-acetyltransferase [Clostridiaceae bacterium]|nr:GNAT family N-acetyltransferase [Eubacteriales bacterium]